MKNQNEAFLHLMDALPADVARRKAMGDIQGALRLIEGYLAQDCQRELFPRLEAEKMRLERLKDISHCPLHNGCITSPFCIFIDAEGRIQQLHIHTCPCKTFHCFRMHNCPSWHFF